MFNYFVVFSETLHDELIYDLVREGLDQCQVALRKLSSSKLFKKYKDTLTGDLRDRKLDSRSFRLDMLQTSVEALVSRLRSVSKALSRESDDEVGGAADDGSDVGLTRPRLAHLKSVCIPKAVLESMWKRRKICHRLIHTFTRGESDRQLQLGRKDTEICQRCANQVVANGKGMGKDTPVSIPRVKPRRKMEKRITESMAF